jgi:hypothetical protein
MQVSTFNFSGIHLVVLWLVNVGVRITVKHSKLLLVSSVNATCFDPDGPS